MLDFRDEYGSHVMRQIRPLWWLGARRVGTPWKRNKWHGYGR